MKTPKNILIILIIVLCTLTNKANAIETPKMHISIESSFQKDSTLILSIKFKNTSKDTIRISDCFKPWYIFFSINISDENNIPVMLSGVGKISFSNTKVLQYITLKEGKFYIENIKLTEILKSSGIVLKKGTYIISVSYHNQYGHNCINGRFISNTINVRI